MSSTSLCSAGSDDGVGAVGSGGGGGDEEEGDDASVDTAAVASARVARRQGGVPRAVRGQCRWDAVRRAKEKRVCMVSLGLDVERRPCFCAGDAVYRCSWAVGRFRRPAVRTSAWFCLA